MPNPFDRRYAAVHTVHLEHATLADGSTKTSRCRLFVQIAVGLVQLILALTLMYFGLMSFKPGFWSTFPTSLQKYWPIRSYPDNRPSSTYDPPSTRPEANYIHRRRLFTRPFPVFQPTNPPVFPQPTTLVSPPIPPTPDPDAQSAKFDHTGKLVHCTAGKFNVANCLNRRFKTGKPSNDVVDAGVLVTQWDLLHDYDSPWVPFNRGDHMVGTIKNAEMAPSLGSYELPGIVISPSASKLFCAYSGDGIAQGDWKSCIRQYGPPAPSDCVPGCNIDFQPIWCNQSICNENACTVPPRPDEYIKVISRSVKPGQLLTSDCAWRPGQLKWAMKQQAIRHKAVNEIIIDARPFTNQLPFSIEAFFVTSSCPRDQWELAQRAHQGFLELYHLDAEEIPLLLFDMNSGDGSPFSVPKG